MVVRLREWRLRRQHSIYTLAKAAGVHWTSVVRIEQGQMSPTVAMLEKLARALEVRVRELLPAEKPPQRRRRENG
jgi:transcriptional regulator with XRE-family HTH domain